MMKRKGKFLLYFLCFSVVSVSWINMENQIPDNLIVASDGKREFILEDLLPGWIEERSVETGASRHIECSFMGVVPIKEIKVDIVERPEVILGGIPVGIYMKTDGVLIIGTGEICDIEGNLQEPVGEIVQSGDYILEVNGIPVSEKEEVVQQINHAVNSQVRLKVLRNEEEIELICPVVKTGAGEQKAGIWIRDDTQGIGTLTYIKEDGSFGALGHGISDMDTSTLLSLDDGNLYLAKIKSIVKGSHGIPGELAGIIQYRNDQIIGDIEQNTEIGIFGNVSKEITELSLNAPVEVAYKQEIREGKAFILSAVSGEIEQYEIEIEKVHLNSKDANKSMVIQVTDERLLELTGGIVQGMSGSPVIQNGRIVGAVTHVLVNDPTRGYGIFIENMLEAAG